MTNRAARIEALEWALVEAKYWQGTLRERTVQTDVLRAMLDELRAEATPPQAEALCECGHEKQAHIYHEGACRQTRCTSG